MPDTKLQYTRAWTNVEDFPHLGFTRSWENSKDYPTYEPNERVVRADMQSLHNEVRDYINDKLIPAVVTSNSTEADRAAAEQQRQTAEQLRQAAEQQRVSETEGIVAQAAKKADDAKYWADQAEFIASGNVNSFNGRKGTVVPKSGDYTADMVGAAPSGYGLGGGSGFPSSVGLSGSSIARGGFFRWDTNSNNLFPFSYGTMIVVPRYKDTESYQVAFGHTGTTKGVMATRRYSQNVDDPWEFINPPMTLGKEYRTTERWKGKPVYTRLVNCGTVPAEGLTVTVSDTWAEDIIDFRAVKDNADGSYQIPFSESNIHFTRSADTVWIHFGPPNDAVENVVVQMWYTQS